jgi:hypothetical protein
MANLINGYIGTLQLQGFKVLNSLKGHIYLLIVYDDGKFIGGRYHFIEDDALPSQALKDKVIDPRDGNIFGG